MFVSWTLWISVFVSWTQVFLAVRDMCITFVGILNLNVNDAIALTIDVDDHKVTDEVIQ